MNPLRWLALYQDDTHNQIVNRWLAIVTASVIGAWAKVPYAIQTLLIVMALDIVSGVLAAFRSKGLSSRSMFNGLIQKAAVFPLLALLHIVEKPLDLAIHFETVMALAFVAYESLSILENCARAGVPIPQILVTALAKTKIKTATLEEIQKELGAKTETRMQSVKSSEVIETPAHLPDLKVDKTVTLIEEKTVTPIQPPPVPENSQSSNE